MRKAIIFHGTGGDPGYCWYPWLGERLEERGYAVELPHYPDLNVEPIDTFLPRVPANHDIDNTTALLALLEHTDAPVAPAILVAGYSTPPNTAEEPVFQETYDWQRIKANVADL
jgi:hypothetical protein